MCVAILNSKKQFMLDTLITSKTRIKLLMKFFLNSQSESYLRSLEQEFGESSNAIRLELNKFEKAGLLTSSLKGNKKLFKANTNHALYDDIHNILLKFIGLDRIIDTVVEKLGDLSKVYLVGDFAKGKDSDIIDLLFVGENINKNYLIGLIEKSEKLVKRRIRYIVLKKSELVDFLINKQKSDYLLLWEIDKK